VRLFNQKLAPLRELSETQLQKSVTAAATTSVKCKHQRKYCKMPQQLLMLLLATAAATAIATAAAAAGHSNYNSVYNEVIPPELKQAIDKELPKEAKFFDELDCEYCRRKCPSPAVKSNRVRCLSLSFRMAQFAY